MIPRVLFFADAGPAVGGGHVMRCLTLAEALTRAGATCAFAATPAAASLLDVFAGPEITRMALPEGPPSRLAAPLADIAREWRALGLVVDHYGFGPGEEALARTAAHRLLVIDDLRCGHLCDLVLDSNLDRAAADYPGVESLIGPRFALVRKAFAEARVEALERRSKGAGANRLLVALGLTDIDGVTGRVVEALSPALGARSLDVVVGRGAPSLEALKALAGEDRRLTLHVDSQQMADLTARADLAIGAGGSSVWERCCMGLATLTVVLADNQRQAAASLQARGAALALDAADPDFTSRLRAAFESLIADRARLAAMSAAASAICDGRGADRVAKRLIEVL